MTPDTNLVRGQTVSVSGTGFGPDQVLLLQCGAGVDPAYQCDLGSIGFVTPDASGAISGQLTVHRVIDGPSGRVNCAAAPGACDLVAATQNAVILARQALGFDPTAPPPASQITVTPSTGLLNQQTVTVVGSGFGAGDRLYVRECATVDLFCSGSIVPVLADSGGGFSTSFNVRLRVGDGSGGATHCLVVDCIVRAESQTDHEYVADAPITFDPAQPVPALPAIEVTPATGLVHDQLVTITGTGFDPNTYIEISECDSTTGGFCGEYLADLQADSAGTFSTTAKLSRLTVSYQTGTQTIVDCAVVDCWVNAAGFGNDDSVQLSARAPITFDGSVPPPAQPTAEVTPHTNLPYRAQVAVHGTGFQPGGSVYAEFCTTGPQSGGCGSSYAAGSADAAGVVDLTLSVKRRIAGGESVIDCLDAGTECSVLLQGSRRYERARVTVTFDPNAPIPPAPVLLVAPDHDLGWRQVIGFGGFGFTPGPLTVRECGQFGGGPLPFEECTGFAQVDANADGVILGTLDVRRLLDFGGGQPLDCATSAQPCTLRVGYNDPDDSASVPLGFDPNSQPPPPPVLTITPPSHLHDGEQATVSGTGFTPGVTVGLAQCRSGVSAIADACDIGRAFVAVADADGAFSTSYTPAGVIGTAQGLLDCTTAVGTCVLAGANANDLKEFATTPLGFDAPELRIHSATVDEGTGGMTEAEVMVELSAPNATPTTVEWRAVPGTAGEGDYMSRRGRAVVPAGATEAMIHVRIEPDALDEPTERFTIEVTAALGTVIVDANATVKIRDDDAAPSVSVRDGGGREARGRAYAEVLLSAPSGKTIIVRYVTHHGSARSGSDYVRKNAELVFLPGETRHFIHVVLVNDAVPEATESFRVELDKAENASIDRGSATVTIEDDD